MLKNQIHSRLNSTSSVAAHEANDTNRNSEWKSIPIRRERDTFTGNIPIEKLAIDKMNRSNAANILDTLNGLIDEVAVNALNVNVPSQQRSGDYDQMSREFDERALLKQRQLYIEGQQLSDAVNGYANIVQNLIKMGKGTGLKSIQRTLLSMYEPLSKAIANEITAIETGVTSVDRSVSFILAFIYSFPI